MFPFRNRMCAMNIEVQWLFIGYCNTLLWYIIPMENGQKSLSLTIKGENVGIDLEAQWAKTKIKDQK